MVQGRDAPEIARGTSAALEVSMRGLLAAVAMIIAFAASASSQQGPQNINANPNAAFYFSAASVAAT